MKAIILAAGYATRLYPLTLDKPKALLPIAGKPILNYITEEIETISDINELIIVSNAKFYTCFNDWSKELDTKLKVTVLDDGTTDDSNKLGAIGDIKFAIDRMSIDEDILIMAGDNIFTFKLIDYYNEYKRLNKDMILVKEMSDPEDLKRMANVIHDADNRVIDMVEKPSEPKSKLAAFASYIYKKDTVAMFDKYLNEGNNPDAPGFFPSWLCKQKDVYAYEFSGECYDIGTPKSYDEVNKIFENLLNK